MINQWEVVTGRQNHHTKFNSPNFKQVVLLNNNLVFIKHYWLDL